VLLAFDSAMKNRVPIALGLLATGAAAFRIEEQRRYNATERFAAAALETLLNAIEANDGETGSHVRRVAACAVILADAIGLDQAGRRAVERVALFHDIGKIHEALFDIVHVPRRLTAKEREEIATHPLRGAQVLAPLATFYPELPRGVLAHHERWDGSGYPRGIRGRRIPIEARIVSIADTFDAVTHTRRYRRKNGVDFAAGVLERGRGTQFDPDFIDLALLPPVLDEMSRVRIEAGGRNQFRRSGPREPLPDVTFRWRSTSLGSSRVRAPRRIE
jgi:HD-GYP domain-containing protein (c-di-GMP phosphodiesterase class II)